MYFIRTSKVRTNTLGQLLSSQQAILFDHMAFSMNPLRLDRVEPGTFGGQKERQNAHPLPLGFDQAVVLSDPGTHQLAHVKGGIIERLSSQEVLPLACSRLQHHSRN